MPKNASRWPSRKITIMPDFRLVENVGEAAKKLVNMEAHPNATTSALMAKISVEVNIQTPSSSFPTQKISSVQSSKSLTSSTQTVSSCMVTVVF
jgi:hypothetical protein